MKLFRLKIPLLFFVIISGLRAPAGADTRTGGQATEFTNPLREGADPWVVRDEAGKRWLWCSAPDAARLVIRTTATLTDSGTEHIVWEPPASGPFSAQVWAPELHFLEGRWHLYFAASDGRNETHRALVLRSDSADPLGSWTLCPPLATGDGPDRNGPDMWAIDMTPLEHRGLRYAVWSGWDTPVSDRQFLYIAKMASPTKLTGPRVRICANDDYLWERTEETPESRGLNEGPQVLQNAGRTFLLYSCGGAWLPTYKLGLLELTGSDPLDPASWKKHPRPVFQSTGRTFGVGHSCFVRTLGGQETNASKSLTPGAPGTPSDASVSDSGISAWWHIYHAKRAREPGWPRSIFLQPFEFDSTGFPVFGKPLPPGSKLTAPREPGGP